MDAIVIAPLWPTAHWYPQLPELAVQRPVILPLWDTLLITLPQEDALHPLKDAMRVVAWYVSGVSSLEVRGISQRAASFVLEFCRPGTEK